MDHGEMAVKLTVMRGERTCFIPPAERIKRTAEDDRTGLIIGDGRRSVSAPNLKNHEDML